MTQTTLLLANATKQAMLRPRRELTDCCLAQGTVFGRPYLLKSIPFGTLLNSVPWISLFGELIWQASQTT